MTGAQRERMVEYAPFALAGLGSLAAFHFDLFEHFCMAVRNYDDYEFDELFIAAFLFLIATCFWLTRRAVLLRATVRQSRTLERQSHALARLDTLTGLPNRRGFIEAMDGAESGTGFLLIDLDGFKRINDEAGHVLGDSVLGEVALRLRDLQECGRITIAARIGGDEFACLCIDDADLVADEVVTIISEPMFLVSGVARVTPSVGIASVSHERRSFDDLLKRADAAMYSAKRSGGAAARRFDPALAA